MADINLKMRGIFIVQMIPKFDSIDALKEYYKVEHLCDIKDDRFYRYESKPHNLVVNQGLARLAKAIVDYSGATDVALKFTELSSDTSTPQATDTSLPSPITGSYKQVSEFVHDGVSATATVSTFYLSTEANGTWAKAGVYTYDGLLFAEDLISPSYTKTSSINAILTWRVNISNV